MQACLGRIESIRPLPGYVGNHNFLISAGSGKYVLKAGTVGAITAEAWACRRVRQAGVPAPEVVAVSTDPVPYLIMRFVPGAPIPAEHDALIEAGRYLRQVHAIEGESYGILQDGRRDTWADVVAGLMPTVDTLVGKAVLDADIAERVRANIHSYRHFLDISRPALLHFDLHLRHIFIDCGKVTAFIDWGDAAFGDPLIDIAHFSLKAPAALSRLLEGYGLRPDSDIHARLTFYRFICALLSLYCELRGDGDWFAEYVKILRSSLDDLESL